MLKRLEPRLDLPGTELAEQGARCAELVARVLAGETEAFRPLVETFEPVVFGLCRKLVSGNETDAEDLTQETFVQAFRYLPTLENHERFAPWLFEIARSLARCWRRRRRVEVRALAARAELLRLQAPGSRGGGWHRGNGGNGGEVLGGSLEDGGLDDGPEHLAPALAELPPEEREVLRLRYFEGLSYEEMAARLHLTFAQVDHLIRGARARLARRINVRRQRERAL